MPPSGTKFVYNPGDPHLISILITDATGQSTLEFAKKHLFKALGIKKVRWEYYSAYYNGAAGLELTPMDMLKFGIMHMQGGLFEGKRIVSKKID